MKITVLSNHKPGILNNHIRIFIDPAIVLSMFMLSFIFVLVCVGFVLFSLVEYVQVYFILCLYIYCCWGSNYREGMIAWDPINRYSPATFLCLSQARTLIYNVIIRILIWFWGKIWLFWGFFYWWNCWPALYNNGNMNKCCLKKTQTQNSSITKVD